MSTVRDILNFCLSKAPKEYKEDWDNVGLLCGNMDAEVNRVLVALDVTLDVAKEASKMGASLIVSHHPLLFSVKSLSDETSEGRLLLFLAINHIAVISLHTNLDSAPGGVNDCLAHRLCLNNIRTLDGTNHGICRIGETVPQDLDTFVRFVKKQLGAGGVRYANGGKSVHCVAVGGGACMDFLPRAIAAGCDTFVTADVKYHQFQHTQALGINLIDAGHFPTEDPVCATICSLLSDQFPELFVKKSEIHKDCVNFA